MRPERSVTVMLRVKHRGRWQRFPAAYGKNGRIRPGFAQVGEEQVEFNDPAYELRYYESRQAKYKAAKVQRAADAQSEAIVLQNRLEAVAAAQAVGLVVQPQQEDRKTLRRTATDYITDAEARGAMEAAEQARIVSTEFIGLMGAKTFIDQITRTDIVSFHAALRKRGCSDRTVANKHQRLTAWLRFAGVDKTIFPPRPRFEKTLPTIYERDALSTIMAVADPRTRLVLGIGVKCGLREQELAHLEFSDINLATRVLRVQGKPRYGFKVKDSEQRDVAIPDELLAELKQWQQAHEGRSLVLGTKTDAPDGHLLRYLKRVARQNGLNCGRCHGCKGRNKECSEWTLHRLRRTYCTRLLRSGIDVRTVQALAGHADLASTLRYLAPASGEELRAKLNKVEW